MRPDGTLRDLLASSIWAVLLSLFVVGAITAPLVAQDAADKKSAEANASTESSAKGDKPKEKKTSDRLDAIEQTLQTIIRELKALQPAAPANPKPATDPKPSSTGTGRPTTSTVAVAPPAMKLDEAWLRDVRWRSIGPANMGGRITDIAVHGKDKSLWWVATASGGLLKTTNHGVTVEHQFDREATVSIGAVEVAPSNSNIVWVGTGEANPRNSVSYGDGVYRSADAGKTWKNMGLQKTFQISRILIHPKDPKTVYVGALGRLYGHSSDRGVYKTTNGGESWERVFFVDDQTGVIDMVMHPKDPKTIIVAMWDRLRDGFDSWPGSDVPKPEGVDGYDPIRKWGKSGGLFKTTDGGANWKRLTNGLPSGATGRIGIDWQLKSPHTLYAIIDCENIGKGPAPFAAFLGTVGKDVDGKPVVTQLMPKSPAEKEGVKVGDVLLAIDETPIKEFDDTLKVLRGKKVGNKISLKVQRGEESKSIEITLSARPGVAQPAQGAPPAGVWLGVTGEDRDGKVVAARVSAGGPSEKAGLKEGDVIAKLEGKDIAGYAALINEIRTRTAGSKVKIGIHRGEEKLELTITLENRPTTGPVPTQPATANNVYMGIQGQDVTGGGAELTEITAGGPAQKAGLLSGDIVEKIGEKRIENYDGLVAAIRTHKEGDKVKIAFKRGGETKEVELTFAPRPDGPTNLRPYSYSYFGQTPNAQDQQGAKGHEYGGVYRSMDGGESWERVNSLNTRPMYFSVVKVDPSDMQRVYVLGVNQFRSEDGGITFEGDFGKGVHADNHDLWIDPSDGRHMVIGGDGGFYSTYDRGRNWDHVNTAAIGQFYHVAISPKQPYWVFGGLQDNGSWGGPAISKTGGAINEDWVSVGGGDGFVCRVDQNDPDLVYYESQNGAIARRHLTTGERASIRPVSGPNSNSYRFNWNTPFILSNHNSKIFYSAGNYVFRSLDRGNNLVPISPEITLTKRGSATALSESPRNPNILYAGTDDGALWVTRDGGHTWKNITDNLGLKNPRWVSTIEASRFADGRVYVCLDAHRSDDDDPYLFASEDYGATWRSIRANIPWGSSRCLREDVVNANMLYAGTEFALWVSLDRGTNWSKMNTNLPTVAIHEIAVHPTNGAIVAATHGRSLWACDVSGLRQLTPDHLTKQIALLDPQEVVRWRADPSRGRTNRRYASENPPSGAQLWYSLPAKADRVSLRVEDIQGRVIRELRGNQESGLHRVAWDLIQTSATPRPTTEPASSGSGRPSGFGGRTGNRSNSGAPRSDTATAKPAEKPTTPPAIEPTAPPAKSDPVKLETPQVVTTPKETAPAKPEQTTTPAAQPTIRPTGSAPSNPTGRPGTGGGSRPVPNGTYRIVLVVDGQDQGSRIVALTRDPNAPADAASEEEVEQILIEQELYDAAKKRAKSEGRTLQFDD